MFQSCLLNNEEERIFQHILLDYNDNQHINLVDAF